MSVLQEHGYSNCQCVYVYKPANNQTGTDCFINAVETVVLAWRAGRAKGVVNFPDQNPTLRHNLFLAPNVGTKCVNALGAPVNTTQKPTLTTYQIGRRFVDPGGSVLVIGSGSGSDVIGFVYAGCNVTGVEKDPKQFDLSQARVTMCMDRQGSDRPRFEADLARAHRMQMFINCNERQTMAQAADAVESKLHTGKFKQLLRDLLKRDARIHKRKHDSCIACGEKMVAGSSRRCKWDGVSMHLVCAEKCGSCLDLFCSESCKDHHNCAARVEKVDEDEENTGEGGGDEEPEVAQPAERSAGGGSV
jgi:hypothetical protein